MQLAERAGRRWGLTVVQATLTHQNKMTLHRSAQKTTVLQSGLDTIKKKVLINF